MNIFTMDANEFECFLEQKREEGRKRRELHGFIWCPRCNCGHTNKTLWCRECEFKISLDNTENCSILRE